MGHPLAFGSIAREAGNRQCTFRELNVRFRISVHTAVDVGRHRCSQNADGIGSGNALAGSLI
jgi:hypothetical protein